MNPTIAFIGAGNLAQTLIQGLIKQGFPAGNMIATRRKLETLATLGKQGVKTTIDNHAAIQTADIVILAVKPKDMKALCLDLAATLSNKKCLIISVASSIDIQHLQQWLNTDNTLVRAMPNTAVAVQAGATGLYTGNALTTTEKNHIEFIFNSLGISCWLAEERLINAIIALSGSGIAYYFFMMEIMRNEAIRMGLTPEIATTFCTQTVLGAAKMASENNHEFELLRQQVTSPNGTTFAALEHFRQAHLSDIVEHAMQAARDRAEEMARQI